MTPNAFRFNARSVFLTYPQMGGDVTREGILEKLQEAVGTLPTATTINSYIVAAERHGDGGVHYHAVLKFNRKIDIRSERSWDILGHHPNIQSPRSFNNTVDYCRKEDEQPLTNISIKRKWAELAVGCSNSDDYLGRIKDTFPRDYDLSLERLQYSARHRFGEPLIQYVAQFPASSFKPPTAVSNWLSSEFTRPDRPKTLLLCGPTRIGKTEWARSLGRHVYWNRSTDWKHFDSSADYIILDDIKFSYFLLPLIQAQKQFVVSEKYMRHTVINFGKPCIWLSNPDPINDDPKVSDDDKEVLRMNVVSIWAEQPFY
nr:MAG: replication associated protein [Arizlama virus]